MIKFIRTLFVAAVLICLMSLSVCAVDVTYQCIVYRGEITIISSSQPFVRNLDIPSHIEGFPVTAIAEEAFAHWSTLVDVTIPSTVKSIGDGAFINCNSMQTITIPNSVTSIGDAVFAQCSSLSSVVIPGSVTNIGDSVFSECSSLEKVTIQNGVTSIGRMAFYNCGNLTSITLPSSITNIGDSAFFGCTKLTSLMVQSGNTRYKTQDGVLYSIDGRNLILYPASKAETTFTIPTSVTTIQQNAFYACNNLRKVIIPATVTEVQKVAFRECNNLSIDIHALSKPEGWDNNWNPGNCPVVWGYGAVSSITLNKTSALLTTAGQTLQLQAVIIPDDAIDKTVTWTSSNTSVATVNQSGRVTVAANGTATITATTSNGKTATCTVTVNIPIAVTDITLDKTTATITTAGGTVQLTATIIPADATNKTVTWTSSNTSVATVDQSGKVTAVANGTAVITATTANGKTATCTVTVNIPIAVTDITLDKTTATIATAGGTVQLTATISPADAADKTVTWTSSNTSVATVDQNGKVTAVKSGDVIITATASNGKTAQCSITVSIPVTGISLNKTFDTIGSIGGTLKLSAVIVPDSAANKATIWTTSNSAIATVDVNGLVTAVAEGICTITSTTKDGGFTASCEIIVCDVGYYAYTVTDGKATITKVDKSISGDVFIPSVLGGYPVVAIAYKAFDSCNKLINITVPNSVTSIRDSAFYYCENLTSIILGNSVTNIDEYAVNGCSSLETITVEMDNTAYKSEAGVLYTKDGKTLVRYPKNKTGTSLDIPNGVSRIGNYAFYDCDNLSSVVIPEGVTSIGEYAFYSCTSLTSIIIPSSVTSIGSNAFAYCSNLTIYAEAAEQPSGWGANWNPSNCPVVWRCAGTYTEGYYTYAVHSGKADILAVDSAITGDITIPAILGGYPVDAIGDKVFYNNDNITSVVIPNSVTSIGEYAFYSCTSLTNIIIPNSVTSIGRSAFGSCTSLTIYAETAEQPFGWDTYWNSSDRPVAWGYAGTYVEGYYTYAVHSGKADILAVDSAIAGDITIPTTLGSYPIVAIGSRAFDTCTNLTSITIPNSVTSIAMGAFSGCSSLDSMVLPFVGGSVKSGSDTYQYPFGYIFGTSSYTGGVSTTQSYYGSSTNSTSYSTYYIPSSLRSVTITGGNILYGAFYNCSSITSITIGNGVTSIGDNAFNRCRSLTSITIPNSVTSIGNYAFCYCSSLTSITIPNNVTSIGNDAFYDCDNLASVVILEGVTSIGEYVFGSCSGLTSIIIPSSVTSIGNNAFAYCSNLTIYAEAAEQPSGWNANWNNSNRPVIWGYVGTYTDGYYTYEVHSGKAAIIAADKSISGDITIPAILGGYPVDAIGDKVFYNNDNITSVVIPNSVTSIGNHAFWYCSSLTSITLGNSVTSIGEYAFYRCTSLTSITIPDSVTSIGNYAFHYCSSLTIYAGVTEQPSGWDTYWNFSDRPVVWGYAAPGGITLDKTTASITTAGGTVQLTVTINSADAADKTVIWTSSDTSVATVDKSGKVTAVANGTAVITATTANGKTATCTVTVSTTVEVTGISLNKISASLTSAGGTTQLIATVSPADATNKTVTWTSSNTSVATVDQSGKVVAVSCGTCIITATTVDGGYKATCTVVVAGEANYTYTVTDGKATITAVARSTSGDVVIPSILGGCPVVAIGENAFYDYDNITSITIPNSVTSIGVSAFEDCSNLKSITIPCSVTSLGDRAFYSCSSLTSITLPESITSIGNRAFYFCSNLTGVNIPSSVASIGEYAFRGCGLTSIIIPSSVTNIGNNAFAYCSNLTIYVEAASKPSGWSANWNYSSRPVVWGYVDGKTYTDGYYTYQVNGGKATITDVDTAISGNIIIPTAFGKFPVVEIGEYAFSSCKLTSVTIPSGITQIGAYAFGQCLNLTSVSIPEGVTNIDHHAFTNCIKLTSITISSTVTNLGYSAFFLCSELTSVNLPSGITEIGDTTFYGCTNLEDIVIPSSVTSIGERAFYSCSSLTSITIPNSVITLGSAAFSGCSGLTVYAEVVSKPVGWDADWNPSDRPVIWGYIGVTGINLDKSSAILEAVGGTLQLHATVTPNNAYNKSVIWTSSNVSIAKVDETGFVTSVGVGTVVISATTAEGEFMAQCEITIKGALGDLDGSEALDKGDAIHLMMHIMFPSAYSLNQNADFTGDSIVDKADAIYLMMHIMFPGSYPIE